MKQTMDILTTHRSIRKYKDTPVSEQVIAQIINAAQWSSTSSHFQAYTIINVQDQLKRETIAKATGGQRWVTEAPLFLVFCADLHRAQKYWVNKQDRVFANNEFFIIATVDATLAAQQAFIAAESLGLGGVYIGGIRNDLPMVSAALNLPELVYPVFGMCLGYPDDNPGLKPRLPIQTVYKVDSYDESGEDERIAVYNQQIKEYYLERTGGTTDESWSERCGRLMMEKTRDNLGLFIKDQGFNIIP